MKKWIAVLLTLTLAAALAACAPADTNTPATQPTQSAAPDASAAPEAPVQTQAPLQTQLPVQTEPDQPAENPADMTLESMMDAILNGVSDLPAVGSTPLDADNFEFFAFAPYADGLQGLASEAMINAVAHSVVLVRVPEGMDVQEIADQMQANMDPRKWICVEAEKSSVTVHDDVILLVMSFETTEKQIRENFDALYAQ